MFYVPAQPFRDAVYIMGSTPVHIRVRCPRTIGLDRVQSGRINIALEADEGFVMMIAAPKTAASTEPVNTPILASAA